MNSDCWSGKHNPYLISLANGFKLHQDVEQPFIAMQRAAAEQGINCELVSSYRDFARQLSIWNRKWRGELPLYTIDNQRVAADTLSDIDKLHMILTFSALPGASRHHWGTDIDVYDKAAVENWHGEFSLISSEYEADGPCARLASWLDSHAEEYGFIRPFAEYKGGVAKEPWHLSHASTAHAFEQALNAEQLKNLIQRTHIEGKHIILSQFDSLFAQYVQNRGTHG